MNKLMNNFMNNNQIIYNTKKGKYFWEYEEEPTIWVSILVASYNTCLKYLYDCIISIKEQIGNFGIELVWVNDCSNYGKTQILHAVLTELNGLKNFRLIYNTTKINRGLSFCLHQGLHLCTNEIIFRMDSDDIMLNERIITQLNPYSLTWDEYKTAKSDWIMNHPTLCFKKSAVLTVGNYRIDMKMPFEDLDLELRILKKYNIIYNIQEPLLLYRTHENQLSRKTNNDYENKKLKMIENYCNDSNEDLINYEI